MIDPINAMLDAMASPSAAPQTVSGYLALTDETVREGDTVYPSCAVTLLPNWHTSFKVKRFIHNSAMRKCAVLTDGRSEVAVPCDTLWRKGVI